MEKYWKNVALRTKLYKAPKKEAQFQRRTVTNCLEIILADHFKINPRQEHETVWE